MGDWSDEKTTSDEDELDIAHSDQNQKSKSFGPIPCFSRVNKVRVSGDPQVFLCTCCMQERMGMPCCHIVLVCQGNATILGDDQTDFHSCLCMILVE